ncbi:protoglobin domain-containing protein [Devosia sediminis]|uniref:Globin-sensor domain-containing protein n=1 Tax=Devosia sediminis TaxID=2798801 RepID=A0A934J270_9HYPH|nr:protoglobin domain-containing protein [Devosia sediminis]MBJ3786299.1 hypothetical protein [Devosia sediminis]
MQDTLQQRLDFIGLGEGVEERLAPVADSAARHLDLALQRFASQVATAPSAARFLYGRERIEGDSGGPATHWRALVSGRLDRSFAEAAVRTGQRHARIGVDPRWHVGSQAIIVQDLVRGMIPEGVATMMKPRRGPLGLLGAPDASAVQDATDALANGVATLLGAVLLDLDLTYSGYFERQRLDAETRLDAQEARLRQSIEAAGRMLEAAAEGRREEAGLAGDDAELAPLRAGAEKLADRVATLIDDLGTASRAAESLANDVLASGKALVAENAAQRDLAQRLAELLSQQAPRAADLPRQLGDLARHGKALARRCARQRRDLLAASAAEANRNNPLALVERIDGLGLSANLVAARLAQSAGGAGEKLDGELHAIALGLAQVSAELRAEADRRDSASENTDHAATRLATILEQLVAELGADSAALAELEQQGRTLADGVAEASALADGLVTSAGQGAEAVERVRASLAGAGALGDLKAVFNAPTLTEAQAEEQQDYPALDYEAIAAHWFAV